MGDVQLAGGAVGLGAQGGGDAYGLAHGHADGHDPIGGVGTVGAGDAAAGYIEALHLPGDEAAIGQVIGDAILNFLFRLSGACWVVDIHQEIRLVNNNVWEPCAGGTFLAGDAVVAGDAPGFPDAGGGGGAHNFAVLIAGKLTAEEVRQNLHLLPKLQFRLVKGLHLCAVHAVYLGGIDLARARVDRGMQPDGGGVFGDIPLLRLGFRPVQEALPPEGDIVNVPDAEDSPVLVHVVQGKFHCHRLHQAVFPALLVIAAGKHRHVTVPGGIDYRLGSQHPQPLFGADHCSPDSVPLHPGIRHRSLQVHLQILLIQQLGQGNLCPLHVVGHAGGAVHVVVRHSQQGHHLIPHGARADGAQNGPHAAGGQVAPGNAVALHQGRAGSLPGRRHGGADSGRACPANQHIIFLPDRYLSAVR